ncbi:MAG: T9SS type A sorting domain-containing protein [Cyclobacteriaceae bacterium]
MMLRQIITGFLILMTYISEGANYFWVGDGGNWSDFSNHWATSSGGSSFHGSAPTVGDDVFFDANSFSSGSQTVTIDVDANALNLDFTGVTNSPDLAGAAARTLTVAADLTFIAAQSISFTGTISLTGSNDVTVNVGDAVKTIPDLEFPNATGNVVINTGSVANTTDRITFGDITLSGDGVEFDLESADASSNAKTIGNITLPNDCNFEISGPNASSFGDAVRTIISGNFVTGDDPNGQFRGQYMEFQGDLTFGNTGECRWTHRAEFTGTNFTIGSSSGNHYEFSNDVQIGNNISINGNTTLEFDNETDVSGDLTVAAFAELNILTTASAGDTDFSITGTTTINSSATVIAGATTATDDFSFGDINCGGSVELTFQNGSGAVSIANLSVGAFDIIEFNANSTTTFSGDITSNGDCSDWRILRSSTAGDQADLSFGGNQTVSGNLIRDLSVSGATFDADDGLNDGNNSGITFNSNHAPTTLYWRQINSGDWSDTNSWSTSSGGGSGSCVPGPSDDVIFDANSFTGANPTFTMDLDQAFVDNVDMSAINTAVSWEGSVSNELIVYGNFIFDSDVTNNFTGPTTFTDGSSNTIDMNDGNFSGDVNIAGGTWDLIDNLDIDGDNSDLTIESGTLDAATFDINLENDWTVMSGATFTAGTGTVTFDGQNSSTDQNIDAGGSAFYNLTVDRQSSNGSSIVRLDAVITISNNFNISQGRFYDDGFQITGNATGTLNINNGERLRLGTSTVSTSFPTNFTDANIDMNNTGRVEYNSRLDQDIRGNITYGNLFLNGGGSSSRTKTLQGGPITVNRTLSIQSFNDFDDNGFQITGTAGQEVIMQANTTLTLGNATTTTQFPTNYDIFTIDANSTIVYASGQNDSQTIKDLNGGGDASYGNLTLTNTSGVSRTKDLDGNIDVRGDLTIGTDNTMDVTGSNFNITLQGNLTVASGSSIIFQQGTFTVNGSTAQTIDFGGGTPDMYNFTVNNSAGILVNDDISISTGGTLTFQDGIVTPQASEVLIFQNGTSVSSASNSSHFNGTVRKIGTDAFTFPVGTGTVYRPISISAPGTATDEIEANYLLTNPKVAIGTAIDGSLDRVSSIEYWNLSITNGTPTVNVTLSWNSTSDVGDLSTLVVAHWNGAQWDNLGQNSTTGDISSGTITVNSVSGFSPFTLGSTDGENPLPVELISFEAIPGSNSEVLLDWATASEINNDFFLVQKSRDGVEWKTVTKVDGKGTTTEIQQYSASDTSPFAGTSYYRLKQVDFDGQFEYSVIRAVTIQSGILRVYPNPVASYLNVDLPLSAGTITITDVNGKFVEAKTSYDGVIDVSQLNEGLYLLMFSHDEVQSVSRFVIKR